MSLAIQKEKMLKALQSAQTERPARPGLTKISTPWGHEDTVPEWNVFEMNAMLQAVNAERQSNGLGTLTLHDIQKVESMACGHSDYTSKFALYCAELTVMEPKSIKP